MIGTLFLEVIGTLFLEVIGTLFKTSHRLDFEYCVEYAEISPPVPAEVKGCKIPASLASALARTFHIVSLDSDVPFGVLDTVLGQAEFRSWVRSWIQSWVRNRRSGLGSGCAGLGSWDTTRGHATRSPGGRFSSAALRR